MTRKNKPATGKRYSVGGLITISMHTVVVASSPEEARELAAQRGVQSLCHQCASASSSEEWVTSGELDCDQVRPYDGEDALDVQELD